MSITKTYRANNRIQTLKRSVENYIFVMLLSFTAAVIMARIADDRLAPQSVDIAAVPVVANIIADELGFEPAPAAETVDADAVAMAKVIYGTCRYNSVDAQRSVCYLILNRVDSPQFPSTIREVCEQPNQWMGYADDNPVVEETYELCKETIKAWRNNEIRPFGKDFVFFVWNGNDSITLRNTYEKTANTRCIQVG